MTRKEFINTVGVNKEHHKTVSVKLKVKDTNKITNKIIDIDENLVDIIKTLNNKGYYTYGCCEGYENDLYFDIFVMFVEKYNFSELPNKFTITEYKDGRRNCRLSLQDDYKFFLKNYPNIEYRKELKSNGLKALKEWVDKLEDLNDK